MERTVTSYEAKTHLPQLLREVGLGYSFTITKHGVPIGRLVAAEEAADDSESLVKRFEDLAKQNGPLGFETYKNYRDEGRRV